MAGQYGNEDDSLYFGALPGDKKDIIDVSDMGDLGAPLVVAPSPPVAAVKPPSPVVVAQVTPAVMRCDHDCGKPCDCAAKPAVKPVVRPVVEPVQSPTVALWNVVRPADKPKEKEVVDPNDFDWDRKPEVKYWSIVEHDDSLGEPEDLDTEADYIDEWVGLTIHKDQKDGEITGKELREKLAGRKLETALMAEYLVANQECIPEGWEKSPVSGVMFLGTVYRDEDDELQVAFLNHNGKKWELLYWPLNIVFSDKAWVAIRKEEPAAGGDVDDDDDPDDEADDPDDFDWSSKPEVERWSIVEHDDSLGAPEDFIPSIEDVDDYVQLSIHKLQKNDAVSGEQLRKMFPGRKLETAVMAEFLAANQNCIPDSWQKKQIRTVSFLGTVYRDEDGTLVVAVLSYNGDEWNLNYCALNDDYEKGDWIAFRKFDVDPDADPDDPNDFDWDCEPEKSDCGEDWSVEEHDYSLGKPDGFDPASDKMDRFVSVSQDAGQKPEDGISVEDLKKKLAGRKLETARMAEFLVANQNCIPANWQNKAVESIFFLGTVFEDEYGDLEVTFLKCDKGEWVLDYANLEYALTKKDWIAIRKDDAGVDGVDPFAFDWSCEPEIPAYGDHTIDEHDSSLGKPDGFDPVTDKIDKYVRVCQDAGQKLGDGINGIDLRNKLAAGCKLETARMAEFLVANPECIPATWQNDAVTAIYFLGTVFKDEDGELSVAYISCDIDGDWSLDYARLDAEYDEGDWIAIRK